MSTTTYISGEIELNNISTEKRLEIKKVLESFYGTRLTEEIFREDYLSFEEEWHNHEDTDNFMQLLLKIVPFIDKNIVTRLMCEGETHQDYWGIVIKKGKLYIQKYKLKPAGDKKEYIYNPVV
ncbi:MAG: hypothetical protein H7263_05525 [Candidatus Sericytochromatia bacterium]|nr:hypothetical protein [Candidatus Sericytochromatia bacterium]